MSDRELPAYPEYVESGIQLIDAIPEDWVPTPIKVVGDLRGGAGFPHDEQGKDDNEIEFHKVNALGSADAEDFLIQSENTVSKSTAARLRAFVFPPETILFAKVGAALLLSRFRWLKRPACLDNNMMGLVTRPTYDPKYVKYSLSVLPMDYVVNPGAVPSISERKVGNLRLAVPPSAEQTQIAKFLDYETAKIDALIEKQQQLIALLKEKRQAVISHAVTNGLNPDAPMRDSGVEWLGEVPVHWRLERAKVLFRDSRARSTDGTEELLTVSHLTGVTPRSEKNVNMIEAESHEGYKLCFPGDLAINTMWAWMGAMGVSAQRGMVSPSYNVYRPTFDGDTQYYDYAVRIPAFVAEVVRWSKGIWSSRLRLYPDEFGQIVLPFPPESERQEIAAHLDEKLKRYADIVEKAETQVVLLQERRTALISAAVTGKIDVRGWKAPESEAKAEIA